MDQIIRVGLPDDFATQVKCAVLEALSDTTEGYLKIGKAASYASVSRGTIDKWIMQGDVKIYQIGDKNEKMVSISG